MQVVHGGNGAQGVGHGHTLGQLQLQQRRIQCRIQQDAADQLGQVGVAKLHGRQIDRQGDRRHAAGDPVAQLLQRGAQYPFPNGQNQPIALGHGNELRRRYRSQLRVMPAQQGFCPHDLAGGQ